MKKNRILFIYSFLYISVSQLYAVTVSFTNNLKEDAENCAFLKKALSLVKGTSYKWNAIKKSDYFVALTAGSFKEDKKEQYKACLEGALKAVPMGSEIKLGSVSSVRLVYQGGSISYYVGGRKGAISLFAKVSEEEYLECDIQKQASHISLNWIEIWKLLKSEFQVGNLLESEVKQEPLGEKLQKVREVLFEGSEVARHIRPDCTKSGEFFMFTNKGIVSKTTSNYVNALNEMFETIQEDKKSSGPFVIGSSKACEYSLRRTGQANAKLYIKFQDPQAFNDYVQKNNARDSMNSKHFNNRNNRANAIEVLLQKRKKYEKIIRTDLFPNFSRVCRKEMPVYVLSDKAALARGLKGEECAFLRYTFGKETIFAKKMMQEAQKNPFCTNSHGWEYYYWPEYASTLYIKIPVEVGKIFKQTERKRAEGVSQAKCKEAILKDIQGEDNDAAKLKQIFGMDDKTHALHNIKRCLPGNRLRIWLNSADISGLFENTNHLKGKQYTYTLTNKNKYIQIDGIEVLSVLKSHKNEQLLKKKGRDDKNEVSSQNLDAAHVPEVLDHQIVKEEESGLVLHRQIVKEEGPKIQ
jgi:hypothetical protein